MMTAIPFTFLAAILSTALPSAVGMPKIIKTVGRRLGIIRPSTKRNVLQGVGDPNDKCFAKAKKGKDVYSVKWEATGCSLKAKVSLLNDVVQSLSPDKVIVTKRPSNNEVLFIPRQKEGKCCPVQFFATRHAETGLWTIEIGSDATHPETSHVCTWEGVDSDKKSPKDITVKLQHLGMCLIEVNSGKVGDKTANAEEVNFKIVDIGGMEVFEVENGIVKIGGKEYQVWVRSGDTTKPKAHYQGTAESEKVKK